MAREEGWLGREEGVKKGGAGSHVGWQLPQAAELPREAITAQVQLWKEYKFY